MNTTTFSNQLFRIINDEVTKMDADQIRSLTVGTYIEIRESLAYEAYAA